MSAENKTSPLLSAIGLESFYDPSPTPAIRLSLVPSFHPKVCITINRETLACAAMETRYWYGRPLPEDPVVFAESHPFSELEFHDARIFFDRAADENAVEKKMSMLDGMPIGALLIDGDHRREFNSNPHKNQQSNFALILIRAAHARCKSPHLLNRIAECAYYLGEQIPLVETITAADANLHYNQYETTQAELVATLKLVTDAASATTYIPKIWAIHSKIAYICGKLDEYVAQHRDQAFSLHQKFRIKLGTLVQQEQKESRRLDTNPDIRNAIQKLAEAERSKWRPWSSS